MCNFDLREKSHKENLKKRESKVMYELNDGYHTYYVYIISNSYRSTFYVGMTDNFQQRLERYHQNIVEGNKTFAAKYNIKF